MVDWHLVMLAAFLVQPQPPALALLIIVVNVHAHHGRDAREAVDHNSKQGTIAQADQIQLFDCREPLRRVIVLTSGMLSSSSRASSGVRTGVLPFLMG
jgi:hypothetical protein